MVFAVAFLEFFPEEVLRMFNASENMLSIGVPAIRILALSMIISVYGVLLGAVLQALGKGLSSMVLAIARQMIFLIPLMCLFKMSEQILVVWLAFPAAEILGILVGLYYHKRHFTFRNDAVKQPEKKIGAAMKELGSLAGSRNRVGG